ncbi:hypothetical protein KI688_006592 [Linnemannia hyalina]|uniref:Uncharacterized protein n=1 Tax=Linnemannia hyalina TaxID=64524 RepID=A0A9P8BNI0_9FUNG|nr:hypothetical protein KI688_006592 [Linnemannia hyalina]
MRNESHTGKLICRVNYYEAIFDTISDDDILAALAEVDQDQDPNTTSQSTIVVDVNDSEDESIIDDNDDDLAAFAEVVQDQDPNTTSQSTIVVDDYEDSNSEDEPLIRRRPGWKSVSSSESIQLDDESEDDLQRPLTQVISTQISSSSHASTSSTFFLNRPI